MGYYDAIVDFLQNITWLVGIERIADVDTLDVVLIRVETGIDREFLVGLPKDFTESLLSSFLVEFGIHNLVEVFPVVFLDELPFEHLEPLDEELDELGTFLNQSETTSSEVPPNFLVAVVGQLANEIEHHHTVEHGAVKVDLLKAVHRLLDVLHRFAPELHERPTVLEEDPAKVGFG